jgi:phosphatidylserine/phosphatidylglycerophosphate/cardiolipin synthase-like enzyme
VLGLLATAILGCDGAGGLRSLTIGESKPLSIGDRQMGPVRCYFTTPDKPPESSEIVAALTGFIRQAQTSIDVAGFEIDNQAITQALVEAQQRGVKVRVVTETNYLGESGITALKAAGVPIVDDGRDGALMHNKFMVFDRKSVWTGSMNFTENCAYRNNNNSVWIDDARIAENYSTKFAWMFEQRKFGAAPNKSARIPHPSVTLRDGTLCENYFSTHDHVAKHVIETIEQARSRIHFLAFSFTHDGIARAMLARASAGVEVQGVFEKSQVAGGHSEFEKFRTAGPNVSVYLDANPRNMHHKVIVIDEECVITGSFNFSTNADKTNDENLVILRNPEIARRFEEEFQRVYGAAQKADGAGSIASRKRPHRAPDGQ